MIRVMTTAAPKLTQATMAAVAFAEDGVAPEWVHLLPTAKGAAQTKDTRGPYLVEDAAAIIAASFSEYSKLQIDENHAEDRKADKGDPSPAHGWITALEARADGIWGKVEWNPSGQALMVNKSYRAMSPVILHDTAKKVFSILRASLVNRPNFRGLATLNQETSMTPMDQIAAACGLAADASAEAIVTAIKALKDKKPDGDVAMQSALKEIGTALGVEGDAAVVLAAAKVAAGGKDSLVALQSQVTTLTTELATIKSAGARKASEAFIDKAIADRRAGVNATNREDLITLHMAQPAAAEKMVEGMPMLTASGMTACSPHTRG